MNFLYSRTLAPWLLIAPAILLGFTFYIMPILFSAYISFTDWTVFSPPHWRGIYNYDFLITADPQFLQSLVTTIVLAIGSTVISIPVALLLALGITASKNPAGWRTIFWLPAITNIVAVAYAWQSVLDPTYGSLNRLLAVVGIAGPNWLTQPATTMLSVAVVMAWMTLGHNILLFSAGLEAIDPGLIEAAHSDGATKRQIFQYITLPLLKPTTLFVTVSTIISGMGTFALILVMTEGGPNNSTLVTALYMYRMAFESLRMGRACAAAILLAAVTILLSIVQWRLLGDQVDTAS